MPIAREQRDHPPLRRCSGIRSRRRHRLVRGSSGDPREDRRVGEEILWELDERAWLFIEPNAARAGASRITVAVAGLDALLERLAARRIAHEPIETDSKRVRHVNVRSA
jgi:hypothetical protein